MNYIQMISRAVCEAKGFPPPLIDTAVISMGPIVVKSVIMAGHRIEPLLKEVPDKEARAFLQASRDDKDGTARKIAELEAGMPALFEQIEQRQKAIAKGVLNAK